MKKKWLILGMFVVAGMFLFFVLGKEDAGTTENNPLSSEEKAETSAGSVKEIPKTKVVDFQAKNGEKFQCAMPKKWRRKEEPESDFMIFGSREGIDVLIEAKEDFIDFSSYQSSIINGYESRGDQILEQGNPIEVNGMHGTEVILTGESEGKRFKCLVYLLESEQNYLQVFASSAQSHFDSAKAEMATIAQSVQRVTE
ncbi:hypothetical protein [Enterococcus florum]|uniref:hypothetical protein n=1 Tax=Enterococcus florum TaxID=2480627 RepID=UPI0011BAE145|nr:hypothetical protein [Enterococcus florum]